MDTLRSTTTLSSRQLHSMNFMVKSSSVALLDKTSHMKAFSESNNPPFHSTLVTVDVHFAFSQNAKQSKKHV